MPKSIRLSEHDLQALAIIRTLLADKWPAGLVVTESTLIRTAIHDTVRRLAEEAGMIPKGVFNEQKQDPSADNGTAVGAGEDEEA